MTIRTISVSTLVLLAFAAVAVSQTQQPSRTTIPSNASTSTTSTNTASSQYSPELNTKEHDLLKKFVGTWNGKATLHGVVGTSASSSITAVSSLTFGRYLTTTFGGQIMDQPFEAVQTWGFNTAANAYETTWIDNNSTGITFNNGTCNEAGTVFTIDGEVVDADGNTVIQRSITTWIDDTHFNLELVSVDAMGGKTPVMTIAFTRQAAASTSWNTKQTSTPATTFASREVKVEVTSAQVDAQRKTASGSEPRN
jgi:Protein of unknown function (DUF1579)